MQEPVFDGKAVARRIGGEAQPVVEAGGGAIDVTPAIGRETPNPSRLLVFHYHTFKNAGTSVDEILKTNFPGGWAEAEFPWPDKIYSNARHVTDYLKTRTDVVAFSSHTALLPLPELSGRAIFPIFFVRHPIDRLQSAYMFERVQVADTFGAKFAKENDFAEYLRYLVSDPVQRQARNFQTHRFACNEPPSAGTERARAMRALTALPFVGLVEQFAASIEKLQSLLKPLAPNFSAQVVHKNQTRKASLPLKEKLKAIEAEIGGELYAKVVEANADDLALFEAVKAMYKAG